MADFQIVSHSKDMLIAIVLDQSSSMGACKPATISGYNEYIDTLRNDKQEGSITVTLAKFSGSYGHGLRGMTLGAKAVNESDLKSDFVEIVYANKPIAEVEGLTESTYTPSGNTPLYDAVGRTIVATDKALAAAEPTDRPRVVMVIITDGEENASQEFSRGMIQSMISEREKQGWGFVFLGANQDAWQAGGALGIKASNIAQYKVGDTKKMFDTTAKATLRARSAVASAANTESAYDLTQQYFTDDEREDLSK